MHLGCVHDTLTSWLGVVTSAEVQKTRNFLSEVVSDIVLVLKHY